MSPKNPSFKWTIQEVPTVNNELCEEQDLQNTKADNPDNLIKNALLKILAQKDNSGTSKLKKIAMALINSAEEGTVSSIKEIIDRIDGKTSASAGNEKPQNITVIVDTGITR